MARARKLCSIVINMLHTAIISNALLTPWLSVRVRLSCKICGE
ncbi:hypothetical protein BLAHAN_05477 [Blautia hansenii DSM 20583]|uniref:Uncharacterized protein n=1 Tax=Blautia hansenii DSM 20583 TaxID=537007 RepID=C9L7V4_BLAHA|nr:hypothetical protein BLAHAN_05477 [Blautia hansenii DSM 20583]